MAGAEPDKRFVDLIDEAIDRVARHEQVGDDGALLIAKLEAMKQRVLASLHAATPPGDRMSSR